MASFGEMVKAGRTAAGLTQRQLANALDKPHTVISNWEHDRVFPNLVTTVEIADLLGLDLATFIRARVETAKLKERGPTPPEVRAAQQAAEAAKAAVRALGESPARRRRGEGRSPSR